MLQFISGFALLGVVLWPVAVGAQQPPLTTAQQQRLASYFAPVLLFHPDEQFYPTEALAPLGDLSEPTAEDAAALAIDRRVRAYVGMPLSGRLGFATVYYRVTPLADVVDSRVAIEYFFYYLFDVYRAYGGTFPLGFKTDHFHDLERLIVVVAWPGAGADAVRDPAAARIVALYPNAHSRDVPDNVWRARGGEAIRLPLHIIVERGSHAMAVDIDENGKFDAGVDANQHTRFVWGIRDHGATWAWYDPRYADVRQPGQGVELAPAQRSIEDSTERGLTSAYGLEPAAKLADAIALVSRLAGDAGFKRASWTVRLFGETDPRTVALLPAPPTHPGEGMGDAAAARYERGFSVGASNRHGWISFYGGGRWLFNTPARLPELMVDAQAAATNQGRFFYTVESFASYRLDFVTRLLVGVGVTGRNTTRHDTATDLLAGAEFRLGHLRIRHLASHNNSLRRTWYDVRVCYLF